MAQVSRQVAQLEDRLQAKLLLRTTRQVRLTELGDISIAIAASCWITCMRPSWRWGATRLSRRGHCGSINLLYGESRIAPLVNDFMLRYPQLGHP